MSYNINLATYGEPRISKILSILEPYEENILRLRFGLDKSGETRTLNKVAWILGETREEIRRIEARAIQKLTSHGVLDFT